MSIVIAGASTLLAVRLNSLRAFLASLTLLAQLLFSRLGPGDPLLHPYAIALLVCDFGLLLLVEDVFFDWQAVMWWTGLLAAQWTAFIALLHWDPALLSKFVTAKFNLPWLTIGPLEILFITVALLLLGKFIFSPDAVGAGTFWALAALFPGIRNATVTEFCIALSALAIGIAVVERSHWIANHDELTGLPGRRAFNEALAALGGIYSIAVVDVDHFKRFNDTFGHDTGDQVLRKVAALLSRVGGGGTSYRCGGEEFAIIFPESGIAESIDHAEEVRRTIEEAVFVARGPERSERKRDERRTSQTRRKQASPVPSEVTVSIGLAEGSPDSEDVQETIKAADKALYKAKSLGRNQVVTSHPRLARAIRPKAPVRKPSASTP